MREYGLDVLEFVPDTAVLCPYCRGVMVRNGTIAIEKWTAHNYLCRKCGKQRRVPTKAQMRRIEGLASKREGVTRVSSDVTSPPSSSPSSKRPKKRRKQPIVLDGVGKFKTLYEF